MKKILFSILILSFTLTACQNDKKKNSQNQSAEVETKTEDIQNYKNIGLEYAIGTKSELGKNLMAKMKEDGPIHALEFCNVQAMPITDSMSKKYNADIKRVSDKNRNPSNLATKQEIEYIKQFSQIVSSEEQVEPIIDTTEDKVKFYYPITTNSMCLKCHGKVGEDIATETYNKIIELYPEDKAIGYQENEVRGIWRIYFDKE